MNNAAFSFLPLLVFVQSEIYTKNISRFFAFIRGQNQLFYFINLKLPDFRDDREFAEKFFVNLKRSARFGGVTSDFGTYQNVFDAVFSQ